MSPSGRQDLIDDLVKLKYDLASDLYHRRAVALSAEAASRKGNPWEYAAYKVLGVDMMSHIALWLDPTWQFKRNWKSKDAKIVYLYSVIPTNRTRSRVTVWAQDIHARFKRRVWTESTDPYWTGSGYSQGPWKVGTPIKTDSDTIAGHQDSIEGFIKDTTWKSRNPGRRIPAREKDRYKLGLESQGELETWDLKFDHDNFNANFGSTTYNWAAFGSTGCSNQTKGYNNSSCWFSSESSASVSSAGASLCLALEQANADTVLRKYATSMMTDCLVTRRRFDIGYQVGEFKDLPQTLRGTIAIFRSIEHLIGWSEFLKALSSRSWWSNHRIEQLWPYLTEIASSGRLEKSASDAYLTFKFGYQSLFQAVTKFLDSPSKVCNDVNILIDRNGRNQTFRRRITLPVEEWAGPNVELPVPYPILNDPDRPYKRVGTRKVTLRCVVNSGVRLPTMDTPKLRRKLFYDKMGWPPRPSDLYNLIPWTWLGDWFLSVVEYLRILEEIHMDRSLINWGMITYESELFAETTQGFYVDTTTSVTIRPNPNILTTKRHSYTRHGKVYATYRCRRDLSNFADAKLTSGKGLSDTQGLILGALVSQYTK